MKQLRQLDEDVLTKLVHQSNGRDDFYMSPKMESILKKTGYKLVTFYDDGSDSEYWVLLESGSPSYRGIYVFRRGIHLPYVIEIPRPLTEFNTLDVGLEFFHDLNAKALLISGTSRRKEYAEFDVTHLQSRHNLFQLVHQVIHRECSEYENILSLQIRGASDLMKLDVDGILSTGKEVRGIDVESACMHQLQELLDSFGLRIHRYRGELLDINYSTRSIAQHAYVDSFGLGEFAVLWVTRAFRQAYQQQQPNMALPQNLGWQSITGALEHWIHDGKTDFGPDIRSSELDDLRLIITNELADFAITNHVGHLLQVDETAKRAGFNVIDFMDVSHNIRLLVLRPDIDSTDPLLIFNYLTHNTDHLDTDIQMHPDEKTLEKFILCRHPSLLISRDPS